MRAVPQLDDHGSGRVPAPSRILVEDDFSIARTPGEVIGSKTVTGAVRGGVDLEGALSIDHGQLRIRSLRYPGPGRAVLRYGPFDRTGTMVLAADVLNGLTTSQSDPRPEGRRARLRRWLETAPRCRWHRPEVKDNLLLGWWTDRGEPLALAFNRAGEDAMGELWFEVAGRRTRVATRLQNLPMSYVIALGDEQASLYAWSVPGAHGVASAEDPVPMVTMALDRGRLPDRVEARLQQQALGEVGYRVDTRVDRVRILTGEEEPAVLDDRLAPRRGWRPSPAGRRPVLDRFDGGPGPLEGSAAERGGRWTRVLGEGTIERTGQGTARVRADLAHPNPGRTVYCLPWSDPTGVVVSAVVVPPGRGRGEGHRGRSGVVLWQDEDNHLVLNHFIDDGSVGVSISAFLRTGGHEEMYDWDATWSNVGPRVAHGCPFRLTVACDGRRFLCWVDDEPVLYRALTDYRASATDLEIRGVGLVANWEWGDDTGTGFEELWADALVDGGDDD